MRGTITLIGKKLPFLVVVSRMLLRPRHLGWGYYTVLQFSFFFAGVSDFIHSS